MTLLSFLNQRPVYRSVLTTYNNKVYQLPINLETINSFFNVNLKPFEVSSFLALQVGVGSFSNPKNFEELAITTIGKALYSAFIKGYTKKQWGKHPKELSSKINGTPEYSK